MKIGIVGNGVVGQATARLWMEHVEEVRCWDTLPERRTHLYSEVLDGTDIVFVCLPTPWLEGGGCDLSAVEKFFGKERTERKFVLRSTVPVGTCRALSKEHWNLSSLIHWPEFLTARCANTDAQIPARNVVGGPSCGAKLLLVDMLKKRFPGVPCFQLTSDESELVKLMTNAFFAVKVAYFNELYRFAKDSALNWEMVLAAVLADGRIAHSHTRVPGPDGKLGFGGACLPKDLANLVDCIESNGLSAAVCRAAMERNREDRKDG